MILVDSRAGSQDLVRPLGRQGLEVEETRLEFGDVAFEGRGEGDSPVSIGVEHKTLRDFINSVRDGRLLGHQLVGMRDIYDYRWLVVEGEWKTDKEGFLVVRGQLGRWKRAPGQMRAVELERRVLTIYFGTGVQVRFTQSRQESVLFLVSLYRWWTDKAMDAHRSHEAVHKPASFTPISKRRRTFCTYPGVGLRVSDAVEKRFRSIWRATNATVEEWAEITTTEKGRTKRLGTTTAAKIVAYLRGTE